MFIDDIDRLPADEVMDILRMVKSICNFTNCVYVLAYDENYVIKAIQEEFGGEGDDYLEKIISFPYKLPEYSNETRIKFLKVGLQGIVEPKHYQQLVETEHCQALLETLVPLYLQTPRRIKRLLNAFSTSYMIAGRNLNWGDLLAIEALKLYSNKTYETIRENKELYLKTIENQQVYESNKHNHPKTDTSVEDKRASLVSDYKDLKLVDLLFPLFIYFRGGRTSYNAYEERWVSHYSFFDHYFHIELNNTVLTEEKVQVLIEVLGTKPEGLSEQLTTFTEENGTVLTSTLHTLIARVPKMSDAQKNALLEWCFNSLDDYTDNKHHKNNYLFFENLFNNLLKHPTNAIYEHLHKKSRQFYEWLCRIQNIEILTHFIHSIKEKKFNNSLQDLVLSEEQMNHLKTLAIEQFKTLIHNENYFQSAHPIPWHFLWVSEEWHTTTDEEPYKRQWFKKAKVYPSVLSQLIECFHTIIFHHGEEWVEHHPHSLLEWGISHEEMIGFLPTVIEYCKTNSPEKVSFMEKFLEEVTELSTD